jgi:hypothetical protein
MLDVGMAQYEITKVRGFLEAAIHKLTEVEDMLAEELCEIGIQSAPAQP